ncbi:GIY-YIG nuclease family protein [Aquicella lusitana]|uniref:Putative endonuclease n=1 Tax=Aquicella lusitana TaxID=254246 RepID=A0A370GI58_9COXI|nr:GIY-YIG nuclease family protein [Aquicella lusitana]RDI42074.1 putative endonuclease [Aquicella lusitana]VVC74419.1 hypothetical protein AQULUS_21850 [Aquicella lusitana]
MTAKNYWIYILYCTNDTFYTGYTVNLAERYAAHLNGTSRCKYTRSFKPLGIAQCWKISGTRGLAMRIERHIKKLPRIKKTQYISEPGLLAQLFPTIPVAKKVLKKIADLSR